MKGCRAALALLAMLLALPRGALCESAAQETLFSSLNAQEVDSVSVTTPERAFVFVAEDGEVSVNGRMADAEAFMTLLEQIAELPVGEAEKFEPEDEPVLRLCIETDGEALDASFYRSAESDAYAGVISAQDGRVSYGMTKAWRIGKLVLTCDGTRIFDENGEETPVEK